MMTSEQEPVGPHASLRLKPYATYSNKPNPQYLNPTCYLSMLWELL
jgi:hypothetical protein